ncbi:MAG: FAD-dependent oxidoreductase [Lachnospiraceae bacterium]|nr:FAD-dependent oxidoreductase [Lachnospiraceae bacterium]
MNSIWQNETEMPEFPSLDRDMKTEVLIIGGGIAGILVAYFLQQKGVRYVLVEKNRICSGTTGHTTAKITLQHGLQYSKLLHGFGRERTWKYLTANRQAMGEYEKLCKNIDCNFERKDSFVYSIDDRGKLEREMEAFHKLGYDARLCGTPSLPIETVGAVCCPNQAQFQPLKFLTALVKDLNIYEHTFVKEMRGNEAVTGNGKIRAEKVIVATHFPFINKHGSYFLKMYQHRSYVLALRAASGMNADMQVNGMFIDEDKKGYSFRNYGDILLLGGGSHRTGKKGGDWEELRQFVKTHYPGAEELCAWAAQDCMTLDNVPYIGRYSKCTHELYVTTGFHKWGMTGAMVAAKLLCDLVTGEENDFMDVFSPSRNMLKPQLLVNGFEATANLLTIAPKRCPHLGCALKWNKAEHTWDCACHGSRFSEEGKVLDNPANGDLS